MALRVRLRSRFPLLAFNAARAELDPHNVLGSDLVDTLMPRFRAAAQPTPAAPPLPPRG